MSFTRREFTRLALAGLPAAAVLGRDGGLSALPQTKPDSLVSGVQIGATTSSYRSMPDQSAAAILRYVVQSGISAVELMGEPVERFAGAPVAGRGAGPGAAAPTPGGPPPLGSWSGEACDPTAEQPTAAAGRGGRGPTTGPADEQAAKLKAWRTGVSMDPFKKLRQMFNDAGVSIYAWKQLGPNMSPEEMEYVFTVAEALGCTHTTLELPSDRAVLKRIGDLALAHKVYAAYHTHTQGSMTAFDAAFAASKGNMANVDFGHWVAAGNVGGTPLQFLQKHHDRIASFHLKDRTTPVNCALDLAWGKGDTPIRGILQLVRRHGWTMPATIELEYDIPLGSNAVLEMRKCLEYCKTALAEQAGSTGTRG